MSVLVVMQVNSRVVVEDKPSDDWGLRIEALAIEKLCVRCDSIATVGVSGTRVACEGWIGA